MNTKQKLLTLALAAGFVGSVHGQLTVGFEDFDGNAVNLDGTTNVFDYENGGGSGNDVFGRLDGQSGGTGMPFDFADDTVADVSGARTGSAFPSDSFGLVGQNSTAFFGLNDANGDIDGNGNSLNNAVWSFDFGGSFELVSISADLGAIGDFEASSTDGFLIEASIDGGSYSEIFRARSDDTASQTYRFLDDGTTQPQLEDPLELFIDGGATAVGFLDKVDPATGNFDTYTSTLFAGTNASTVDLRVSWAGSPSGSEPMGIDNFSIEAVPEPEFYGALVGLLAIGFAVIRRRRS